MSEPGTSPSAVVEGEGWRALHQGLPLQARAPGRSRGALAAAIAGDSMRLVFSKGESWVWLLEQNLSPCTEN